jgi:hypothetical protein
VHMRESTESLSASLLSPFRASFFVSFLSPSASSLIQSFSVALDLHQYITTHFPILFGSHLGISLRCREFYEDLTVVCKYMHIYIQLGRTTPP